MQCAETNTFFLVVIVALRWLKVAKWPKSIWSIRTSFFCLNRVREFFLRSLNQEAFGKRKRKMGNWSEWEKEFFITTFPISDQHHQRQPLGFWLISGTVKSFVFVNVGTICIPTKKNQWGFNLTIHYSLQISPNV